MNELILNEVFMNQAFVAPIDSENAKCHPDLGDGRRSYKDNDYMVFQHGEQWYFIPSGDSRGGFVPGRMNKELFM